MPEGPSIILMKENLQPFAGEKVTEFLGMPNLKKMPLPARFFLKLEHLESRLILFLKKLPSVFIY